MISKLNDPTSGEVRFVPETGAKRPYEVWLRCPSGWYQRGSFATQSAADKKLAEIAKLFKFNS